MTRLKSTRIVAINVETNVIANKTFRKQPKFSQFNSKQRKKEKNQKVNDIYILSIAMRIYYRLQCEHIIDCNVNILSIAMLTYYRLQ